MKAKFSLGLLCAASLWLQPATFFADERAILQADRIEVVVPAADSAPAKWRYTVADPGTGWIGGKIQ
jgi:hypothetical protein